MRKIPVIAVVGPTASGKTDLSLALASRLRGQIVAMDSMQVYRGMDIGTAKPTFEQRSLVKHHLIDVCDPIDAFSVSDYARLANEAIHSISEAGFTPVMVGGTGFYLKAIMYGLTLGGAPGDDRLRRELERGADTSEGRLMLHERLSRVDPVSASKLHPNDIRRVVRAIEVYELTGKPFSSQAQSAPDPDCPCRFLLLGATMDREALYRRIDARVTDMLSCGLLSEVGMLLESGVSPRAQSMQGLGYKELVPVLLEGKPIDEAAAEIRKGTRHYAKRQWTWFRAEKAVNWLDTGSADAVDKALALSYEFLLEDE